MTNVSLPSIVTIYCNPNPCDLCFGQAIVRQWVAGNSSCPYLLVLGIGPGDVQQMKVSRCSCECYHTSHLQTECCMLELERRQQLNAITGAISQWQQTREAALHALSGG